MSLNRQHEHEQTGSKQFAQILFAQTGLPENIAEGAGTDFAVQRDHRAPMGLVGPFLQGDVAALPP